MNNSGGVQKCSTKIKSSKGGPSPIKAPAPMIRSPNISNHKLILKNHLKRLYHTSHHHLNQLYLQSLQQSPKLISNNLHLNNHHLYLKRIQCLFVFKRSHPIHQLSHQCHRKNSFKLQYLKFKNVKM